MKELDEKSVEKGCYHEGVPAMTLIVDGGWSKRSHKHSYNAISGVANILGKETRKLLYMKFATSIAKLVLDRFQRRNMIVLNLEQNISWDGDGHHFGGISGS